MENILIVSSFQSGKRGLEEILNSMGSYNINIASNGSEARKNISEKDFDFIIINAPLSDELGDELSRDIRYKSSCEIILIVKKEIADEISAKVEDVGVFVIAKPIGKQFFYQVLKLVESSKKMMEKLRLNNIKLQNKIDEVKIVYRTKCLLIEKLNITEEEAHRYIEKQAMNSRVKKKDVCKDIIDRYEVEY